MILMAEHIWRRDLRWLTAAGVVAGMGFFALLTQEGLRRIAPVAVWRHAWGFQVQPAVLEGVIVDLAVEGAEATLQMITMDGRDRRLRLNMQTTAVFVPGAVLNPSHLSPGQHIEVMASLQGAQGMVRAIRIVKSP